MLLSVVAPGVAVSSLSLPIATARMSTLATAALVLAAFLGHGALWVGVTNRVHGYGLPRIVVDSVTLLCVLAFGLLPLGYAAWAVTAASPSLASMPTAGAAYLWCCVAVFLAYSIARAASAVHAERHGVVLSEAVTPLEIAGDPAELVAPGARRLALLPGNQVLDVRLATRELLIPKLPRELDGYRIAHLTDLHMSGRVAKAYFEAVIERALAEAPDLIALTGDLVEYTPQHAWLDGTLLRLAAPDGVYFVLGNHDAKHDHRAMIERLTGAGLSYVGGRAVERTIRGERVAIVGSELPWFRPAGEPPQDAPADFTLCLAHGPDQFRWAERCGVDLLLAGHNHGGQIRVPGLGALVTPSVHGTRYNGGTFRRGRTVMHVSRGVGSLAPIRYNCPPEFSVLVLRSAE